MFRIILFVFLSSASVSLSAQFGYGLNATMDLYSYWHNPDRGIDKRSSGSAVLNLGAGPKIWLGSEQFSVSAQASAVIAPFALNVKEFNGLGAVYFPVLAKLNFGGASSNNKNGQMGFGIGGGFQYNRTELFGVTSDAQSRGIVRKNFRTYITEASFGYGLSGFSMQFYIRYGWDPVTLANTFNAGISYDFNLPKLKELTDPEF